MCKGDRRAGVGWSRRKCTTRAGDLSRMHAICAASSMRLSGKLLRPPSSWLWPAQCTGTADVHEVQVGDPPDQVVLSTYADQYADWNQALREHTASNGV